MSVKSTLFKATLAIAGAYVLYKGYKFGKAIYLEAKEELDKQLAASGKAPLEKVIGEAVEDAATATREAGRTVRASAGAVIDAATDSANTLTDVVKGAAAHVAVEALNSVAQPPVTTASTDAPGEGGDASPRPAAAAPESQEAAGGANPATGQATSGDASELPPVKD